jgi:hypothetical protein
LINVAVNSIAKLLARFLGNVGINKGFGLHNNFRSLFGVMGPWGLRERIGAVGGKDKNPPAESIRVHFQSVSAILNIFGSVGQAHFSLLSSVWNAHDQNVQARAAKVLPVGTVYGCLAVHHVEEGVYQYRRSILIHNM